jgi:hypothetical protein
MEQTTAKQAIGLGPTLDRGRAHSTVLGGKESMGLFDSPVCCALRKLLLSAARRVKLRVASPTPAHRGKRDESQEAQDCMMTALGLVGNAARHTHVGPAEHQRCSATMRAA